MKVAVLQYHSQNNEDLFNLTIHNHITYCNYNNYSLISIKDKYSEFINFEQISYYMKSFDFLFTVGSDCIFTNLNMKAESFSPDKYVSICPEGWNSIANYSLVNGEMIFFNKIDENFFNILNFIDVTQYQYQNIFNKDDNLYIPVKDNVGRIYHIRQNLEYGTQSVLSRAIMDKHPVSMYLNILKPGLAQSYVAKYIKGDKKFFENFEWYPDSYICHFLGSPDNGLIKSKKDCVEEFFNEYPEYK